MYGQSTNINDTNVYVNIHLSESDEDLMRVHATNTRPNCSPVRCKSENSARSRTADQANKHRKLNRARSATSRVAETASQADERRKLNRARSSTNRAA